MDATSIDCYWFMTGSMKRIRYASFQKLLDNGFIEEIGKTEWKRGYCVITEKGEDFLNKNS